MYERILEFSVPFYLIFYFPAFYCKMEKQKLAKSETLLVKPEISNKLGTRMFKYEKASLFKAKQHNLATKIYNKSKINEQGKHYFN